MQRQEQLLLYGATAVTIWGYSLTPGGAANLPGPVLEVNQGDCVQVTLHNNLSEPTALLFQGQDLIPDTTGAGAGGTQIYNFLASNPGTFLYEAGLIPGKQHQVAMGLYGALIVHTSRLHIAFNALKKHSCSVNLMRRLPLIPLVTTCANTRRSIS